MINCIIVDDEPKAIDVLRRYIEEIDYLHLVSSYREPLKALEQLQSSGVELIFLDINMPGLSGIDFKKNIDKTIMVIFTTAYSEYAIESYNINAIDYLLKPVTFERFVKATNKAFEIHALRNQKANLTKTDSRLIFLKSGPQLHQVKLDDILFLEKDGNYLTVTLKDGKIVIRENMSDVFNIIPKDGFVRVHKSFVVAIKHLETIESEQVIINKIKIPIGVTYKDDFFKIIEKLKREINY